MAVAVAVQGLSKRYQIGQLRAAYGTLRDSIAAAVRRLGRSHRDHRKEIWALRDVSFQVPEGQVLGIIGRNGAGKSTLLKILTRITTPSEGRAEIRGRVGSLLEVGTGFHPELTGRENIFLNGAVLGMKRREIARKLPDIVEFSGIERFIDTPVKRYSSGMYVRLAFSVAAHLEPEILLVDEVLAVGDAEFQRRCLGRMQDIGRSGRTVLFVSHQMGAVTRLCQRAILLDRGQVVLDGPSHEVVGHYLQTGLGGGPLREWPTLETAPGNDLVRLRWVRGVQDGRTVESADVRRPIGIEIAFRVLRSVEPMFPKIKLFDGEGGIIFNALDTDRRWHEAPACGDYVSTAWIPGNLLNEGLVTVDVGVVSLGGAKLRPHAAASMAVSFTAYDPGEGDSARGLFTGRLRGAVLPLLDWETELR